MCLEVLCIALGQIVTPSPSPPKKKLVNMQDLSQILTRYTTCLFYFSGSSNTESQANFGIIEHI